ncbi:MAG TPA: 2Fe-2S iron-sulfur cluster-binding protein [archaeon]|nr:2Fe-2S iron-sulfur cluster-binding protein [archaeon]
MKEDVILKIDRFDKEKGRWTQKYNVPRHKGLTVLDALIYIHENLDETLTMDYNCRAGRCGTCGVMRDGKPALACETLIKEHHDEVSVSPKSHHETIKDLMCFDPDAWEVRKKILEEAPFTQKEKGLVKILPHQLERFHKLDVCIECGLCQSACPNLKQKGWVGPMHGVYIAKLDAHPNDAVDRAELMHKVGVAGCNTNFACQRNCPKNIPITRDALIPEKEKWNSKNNTFARIARRMKRKN